MIYTVTFNPALDYTVCVPDFTPGQVNRTEEELLLPGGKGINVSIVLHNLGMESTVLGFIAGFTGEEIRRQVRALGIPEQFLMLKEGMSRINVKLRSKQETDINGGGPTIDANALEAFYAGLEQLHCGDVLVLAGSVPAALPPEIYRDILLRIQDRILTVVDATGELLSNALEARPFLIKPNHHELGDLFGVSLRNKNEVISYAKKLQERGARNVLVSMAGDGAVLLTEQGTVYEHMAPEGCVVNAVGAGDSMVAGFLREYLTTQSFERAFYFGLACGSASAFSDHLATAEDVRTLCHNMHFDI